MDSQSLEGMPSQKRQNMREPHVDKGLRDSNGKFTGDFLPHRKYKMIEQWDFSEDEYQCFLRDIDALINKYIAYFDDHNYDRRMMKKLVRYGLFETWIPKLEQNFTNSRAIEFIDTFALARLGNNPHKYSYPLSPPSIPETPRPRLGLTPVERARNYQPISIVERPDLELCNAESTKLPDRRKRDRNSSDSEDDHPERIKKQPRATTTESNSTTYSKESREANQVSAKSPKSHKETSQVCWPLWTDMQIMVSYKAAVKNSTVCSQHAISPILCCDVGRLRPADSANKLENAQIDPEYLSYRHLKAVMSEKLRKHGLMIDTTDFGFQPKGYHANKIHFNTSVGFEQAFRFWWQEPRNREVKSKTGRIIWWLVAEQMSNEHRTTDEEEMEMPDFDSP